jgi:hypothetical protein
MPETGQPKLTPLQRALKVLPRILVFFAIVTLVAWTLRWTANVSNENPEPAGLLRGALHGALMPLALPSLAFGQDVPIFAEQHTGRTYKLGYVIGVNLCGLLFFGLLFRRMNRWRKLAQQSAAKPQ